MRRTLRYRNDFFTFIIKLFNPIQHAFRDIPVFWFGLTFSYNSFPFLFQWFQFSTSTAPAHLCRRKPSAPATTTEWPCWHLACHAGFLGNCFGLYWDSANFWTLLRPIVRPHPTTREAVLVPVLIPLWILALPWGCRAEWPLLRRRKSISSLPFVLPHPH